jgi:hypothetical protein
MNDLDVAIGFWAFIGVCVLVVIAIALGIAAWVKAKKGKWS